MSYGGVGTRPVRVSMGRRYTMYDIDHRPPVMLAGRKEDLDAANVWVRSVCHSLYGPERGEVEYRRIPALAALLAFRYLVDTGEVH